MDKTDIRILRELTQATTLLPARPGLEGSFREIARKLSLTPGTVRNRMNRMYESGVLTGVSVYPNPDILGLESGSYAVEVPQYHMKGEAIERFKLVEGVTFIQNFYGGLIGLAFVYEDEPALRRKLALIRSIAGTEVGMFSKVRYPLCTADLSLRDWELISRLTRGGVATYPDLAKNLGTSVRTLGRRVARLVGARAVLSVPTMDYRAIQGGVPADAIVTFMEKEQRGEAEKEILRLLGERMIYAGVWEDFGMYSLILPTVAAAASVADGIRKIEGVRLANVQLVVEHIDLSSSLGAYVDRRLTSMKLLKKSRAKR